MQHIDEHTLELFVLGSAGVAKRRQEIEAHIAECHGCRELVEQISTFYKEAGMEFGKHPKDAPVSENALIRSRNELKPVFEPINSPPIPYRPITAMQKFYYFTRRHPVVVGGGTVGTFAVMALALNFLISRPTTPPPPKNTNPAKVNFANGRFEVFNKEDSLLWSMPSPEIGTQDLGQERRLRAKTKLADLNGDGINEVLTTIRFSNDGFRNHLKIIDANKILLHDINFDRPVLHKTKPYSPTINAGNVEVLRTGRNGDPEIYVSCKHVERSPSFVVRLDHKGNEMGTYWHFGAFALQKVTLEKSRKEKLLCWGINDINDSTHLEFPAFTILNPESIVGATMSTATRVFRLALSGAELYYVRMPLSDMNLVLENRNASIIESEQLTDSLFMASVVGNGNGNEYLPRFAYYFSSDLTSVLVKSDNSTDAFHTTLRREGRITSTMNDAYRENLRQGVRYWDGEEWRKEVTRVKHQTELSTGN